LDGIAAGATTDATVNAHIADTSDAHDASAISIADVATQYTATDVEAALAEVKVIADAAVTPAEAAAAYQPLATVLTNTTASFTTADETKLDGIEASADVTDATNVAAAGAVMESDVAAKGDLFVATADNTVGILTVGTNTHVLTADSTTATGVKWAAAGGGSADGNGGIPDNAGYWYETDVSSLANHTATLDRGWFVPITFDADVTLDRIAIAVQTVGGTGSVCRLGVYADNSGLPSSLIADFGTVDTAGSTGQKTLTISQAISKGVVWLCVAAQVGTAPVLRGASGTITRLPAFDGPSTSSVNGACLRSTLADVSSALPSTASVAVGSVISSRPNIAVRLA
jgi:hypothetical protein